MDLRDSGRASLRASRVLMPARTEPRPPKGTFPESQDNATSFRGGFRSSVLCGTPIREGPEDRIQNIVEALADVLGEEPQYKIAILLQQHVFTPIAAIGLGIAQMLATVELDRQALGIAEQIDFHSALTVKRD